MSEAVSPPGGFVPPPYPHDRLDALRRLADAVPGGVVDCSIGNPVDPIPEIALQALAAAAPDATSYPPSIGTVELRTAAAEWIQRRFGIQLDARRRHRVRGHQGARRLAPAPAASA